ncbi:MAG: sigma-70 family RNA polymerase sigma factor [Gemmataceae bacterium]
MYELEPAAALLATMRSSCGAERDRAFTELLHAWEPTVGFMARRYAPGSADIPDYEQIARLAMLRAVERYRAGNGNSFERFARKVLRNALLDERLRSQRRARRLAYFETLPVEPATDVHPAAEILREEASTAVRRELLHWSQRLQEVVDLLYRQGHKPIEVARLIGRTPARVSQLIKRIRTLGRKSLAPLCE